MRNVVFSMMPANKGGAACQWRIFLHTSMRIEMPSARGRSEARWWMMSAPFLKNEGGGEFMVVGERLTSGGGCVGWSLDKRLGRLVEAGLAR